MFAKYLRQAVILSGVKMRVWQVKRKFDQPKPRYSTRGLFFSHMNTGQIIKAKRKHGFSVLPNELTQSSGLTLEEKGMLAFLLSLPDDWVLYKKNLYDRLPDGKHTIDRVFKSLQEKGYIFSKRQVDEATGKMVGWNHVVYDSPQENYRDQVLPISGFIDIGENRQSEEPGIYKETPIQRKKDIQKEITATADFLSSDQDQATLCSGINSQVPAIFEDFRKRYGGIKKGASTEFKTFKKHKDWKESMPLLLPALEKEISARETARVKKEFFPAWKNLQTWLNQRCWEQEFTNETNTKQITTPVYDENNRW